MPATLGIGFLVASPSLLDPNFKRAVVLLTTHKAEGSLGFVINREAGMSFREVSSELELIEEDDPVPEVPVMSGGPVAPETGWLMFDPREAPAGEQDNVLTVSDGIHISTSREMLERVAKSPETRRHMLLLGYAGWGARQLDEEIKQGVWIPVDLDERIVFETPVDERWERALASIGINPFQLVGMPIIEA